MMSYWLTLPSSTSRAANRVVVPCTCNRGSSCRRCRSSSVAPAGCGQGPGSATSRPRTAPRRAPAGRRRPPAMSRSLAANCGELASHGAGGDVIAAPGSYPFIEGAPRSRAPDGLPGRLDQQVTGVRSPALGDPTVVSRAVARLVNAWIEPDIGGQLVGLVEALDLADGRHQPDGDHHINAGDGHQPDDVGSASAAFAMSRSTPACASVRRSYSWVCCSTASCSSFGRY